jgi:hypothetical protein
VGTVLGTLFRFWSYRKWVWTAKDAQVLAPGEPDEAKAQDLAAVLGTAPVSHGAVRDVRTPAASTAPRHRR